MTETKMDESEARQILENLARNGATGAFARGRFAPV
jgi:hypothetical protein